MTKFSTSTHCIKKPAPGATTAYLCDQFYNSEKRRTVQDRLAYFNKSDDPDNFTLTNTKLGRLIGFEPTEKDWVMVKKWLKKNSTFGEIKVPAKIRRELTALAEARVRAELGAPKATVVTTAPSARVVVKANEPETLNDKMLALLEALDNVKKHFAGMPKGTGAGLSEKAAVAWRMSSFAFSEVLELAGPHGAGRPRGWQTGAWAPEAIALGYYSQAALDASRKTPATTAAEKTSSTGAAMSA